jgi:hypothetical protein
VLKALVQKWIIRRKGLLLCGLLEGEGENERERKKIKKMKRKI